MGKLSYIAEDIRSLAIPISQLVPDPKNARTHDEENQRATVASLRRFGQRKPIVVNVANGMVIEAGNGLYLAAQELGWTHLAVVRVRDDPDSQIGYALADNRTAELARWDNDVLREAMFQTAAALPDLYDALLLHDLLKLPKETAEESPADAEPPAEEPAADPPEEPASEATEAAGEDAAAGPTLEEYFRLVADSGGIDHAVRVTIGADKSIDITIHPQDRDGQTLDFAVHGNTIFLKK